MKVIQDAIFIKVPTGWACEGYRRIKQAKEISSLFDELFKLDEKWKSCAANNQSYTTLGVDTVWSVAEEKLEDVNWNYQNRIRSGNRV